MNKTHSHSSHKNLYNELTGSRWYNY